MFMEFKLKNFIGTLIGFFIGILIVFSLIRYGSDSYGFSLSFKSIALSFGALIVGYVIAVYVYRKK